MRRKDFDAAAAAARKTGRETQVELAHNVARDLMQNPALFDPKRLMPLDRDGIVEMLRAVEEADAARLIATPISQHVGGVLGDSGWADLRRPEFNYWIRGTVLGAASGVCTIVTIGLATMLLG